jgi:DNA mismatch endonuclease (patch repair protein)
MPASNRAYWRSKISRNIIRDRQTARVLKASGWKIIRIWAHALSNPNAIATRINSQLRSAGHQCNISAIKR